MRPVSARLLATVTGSHGMASYARLCTTFQTGVDPVGTELDIVSGDVTQDGTADIRSSLDIQVVGDWPNRGNSNALGPFGNEIFVQRAVAYGNGSEERVSLGYFRIVAPDRDDAPKGGVIRLMGYDRMWSVIRARLLAPRQFIATMTNGQVVSSLILDVYPLATIEWDEPAVRDRAIGRSVLVESDRFAGLDDVVKSCGKIFYWDYRGILVIKALPNPEGAPVTTVSNGAAGVLVEASQSLSVEGVYNAVVASGEAPDEGVPARGVAVDNNPSSPTYFYGKFGQVPEFYSSPLLLTDAAARTAATTILKRSLGLPYSISFGMIVNPALEPYDVVSVRYNDVDGTERHVIESLNVPLLAGDKMTCTTRQQPFVIVGTT